MAEPKTLKLESPITNTDGAPLMEIVIREPTAKQLRIYGMPVSMATQEIIWKNAMGMLEGCSGIQMPVLDNLPANKALEAVGILADFFGKDESDSEEKLTT